MSKSTKIPIYKDVGHQKKTYWRTIRRIWKQFVKADKELPHEKSLVNDYDYSDYKFDFREWDKEHQIKHSRK